MSIDTECGVCFDISMEGLLSCEACKIRVCKSCYVSCGSIVCPQCNTLLDILSAIKTWGNTFVTRNRSIIGRSIASNLEEEAETLEEIASFKGKRLQEEELRFTEKRLNDKREENTRLTQEIERLEDSARGVCANGWMASQQDEGALLVGRRMATEISNFKAYSSQLLREQKELETQTKLLKKSTRAYECGELKAKKVKKHREQNFVYACAKSDCNGTLNDNFQCISCGESTCHECLELIVPDVSHECSASGKAIKRECKPCPCCHAMINKASGCSQIWCTRCHVAFDFNTGKRDKFIHNPHYFEWLADNPGKDANAMAEAQILGGRERHEVRNEQYEIQRLLTSYSMCSSDRDSLRRFTEMFRNLYNFGSLGYLHEINSRVQELRDNKDIRMRFLCGIITNKKAFYNALGLQSLNLLKAEAICKILKKLEKNVENHMYNFLNGAYDTQLDFLSDTQRAKIERHGFNSMFAEVTGAIKSCNKELDHLRTTLGVSVCMVSSEDGKLFQSESF